MPAARLTAEEIGRLGEAIYDRDIRARVEPQHDGKFLVLDVLSGDYEIDADEMAAGIVAWRRGIPTGPSS